MVHDKRHAVLIGTNPVQIAAVAERKGHQRLSPILAHSKGPSHAHTRSSVAECRHLPPKNEPVIHDALSRGHPQPRAE